MQAGQRLTAQKGSGLVLRAYLDNGLAIIIWWVARPQEAALGALANSVALYGVEPAEVEARTLSAADTAAAKAM